MNDQVTALAEQAKRAAANIVRLVAHAMAQSDEPTRAAAFEEEQEMMLALIAAVIGADGVTTHHESVFASLMGKNLDDPACCRAYLEEYAARWNTIATTTPSFVSVVLRYDLENKTNLTRRIVHELRMIVCCTALADGELQAANRVCRTSVWSEWMDSSVARAGRSSGTTSRCLAFRSNPRFSGMILPRARSREGRLNQKT